MRYQPHQALLDLTNSHLIHVGQTLIKYPGARCSKDDETIFTTILAQILRIEAHFLFHFIIKFNTYTFRQQLHNNRKCHLSCENRA